MTRKLLYVMHLDSLNFVLYAFVLFTKFESFVWKSQFVNYRLHNLIWVNICFNKISSGSIVRINILSEREKRYLYSHDIIYLRLLSTIVKHNKRIFCPRGSISYAKKSCRIFYLLFLFFVTFTLVAPHGNLIIPYSWLDTDGKGMTISPSKIGEDIGITGIFQV